jgi:hypothetical protein
VALYEAKDALRWLMRITQYFPIGMVIKIIVKLATFFYIVDYKIINCSFMFTIKLHCFNPTLTQSHIRISLMLDWE